MEKNCTGYAIRQIRISQGKTIDEIKESLRNLGLTRLAHKYEKVESREAKVYDTELIAILGLLNASVEQLFFDVNN